MKEGNYLIFITSQENLPIINNKGVIGFKKRFLKSLKKLSMGDKVILYIKGKKIRGLFEINSEVVEDNKDLFEGDLYPLRLKLKKVGTIKQKEFINQLIPRLDFITNKKHWMGNFQGKSFINISKKDFKLLGDYLNEK